ncbi:hypothetical protein ABIB86_000467 [Bradyrhizobium sp. JR1.7]|uniref:HNH endonuclease n=1 Tax=unclassified Bradyrhizobium TaxID=2631580 RepID=UPI0033974E84
MLTLERLKTVLSYDAETGEWRWIFLRGRVVDRAAGGPDSDGYLRVKIAGIHYRLNRLAVFYMTGEWPDGEVDHRDLDRTNNKWVNLRAATKTQNEGNKKARIDSLTGVKGVRRSNKSLSRPFEARIRTDGKRKSLGHFETIEGASAAYQAAAKEAFGEFARS